MTKYKTDIEALRALDTQAVIEYDEEIKRNIQREIEQKRRDEEEARRKKAKKKRRGR